MAIVGMGGIGKTNLSLKFCKGGIGKTDLSLKLAKKIQNEFEYIIWKSLKTAPPVEEILLDLIKFLSNQQEFNLPNKLEDKVSLLLQYLQAKRCLLILDNVERILKGGERSGQYLEEYGGYGEIFRQVGQTEHKSCLLLTSRETPRDISQLEREKRPVKVLPLSGLDESAARQIFTPVDSFSGTDKEWEKIIKFYNGNPLALQIVAKYILNQCGGNLSQFLKEETPIFGDLKDLLDWHFQRFSSYEKEIMYWFAINQEPVSNLELKEDILSQSSKKKLPGTLESLENRLPIERSTDARLTLQPVLIEYMTNRLVEEVFDETRIGEISLLNSHALLKAQAPDYVRETQKRLILKPLVDRFKDSDIYIEDQLDEILDEIRQKLPKPRQSHRKPRTPKPSYAAGNILNLFCYLGIDLTNYNFSNLSVFQAYLQGVSLKNVDFSNSNLSKSVFTQAFGSCLSVSFSSDGELLAAGSRNGNIYVWRVIDTQNIKYLHTYVGHQDAVRSVVFFPNGNKLVSGSHDSTVRIWDVQTGDCLKILTEHSNMVRSVAISSDGQKIASSGDDKIIRIWNYNTDEKPIELIGHSDWVGSITFSYDDTELISSSHDRTIKIWDINTGECLKTLEKHTDRIWTIAVSPNGKKIASGSNDRTIKIWDANTQSLIYDLTQHRASILSIAFSPNSKFLASAASGSKNSDNSLPDDTSVKIWCVETGQLWKTLEGHTNRVMSVTFRSDSETIASCSDDQTIKIWNINTGKCLKTIQGYTNRIWSVAINNNENIVACSNDDKTVRVWNIDKIDGEPLSHLSQHSSRIRSVAISPDGKIIATGSEDHTIKLWKLEDKDFNCLQELKRHTNRILSIKFSYDSNKLVSIAEDQLIIVWDVNSGEYKIISDKPISDKPNGFFSVAFDYEGQRIITGSEHNTIKVWDIDTKKCLDTLEGHEGIVWTVSLSMNNQLLASGSADKTIKIWKWNDKKSKYEFDKDLRGHKDRVLLVNFISNDQEILSASADQVIQKWNIETGSAEYSWEQPRDRCWSFSISPDGTKLINGTETGILRIWNLDNYQCFLEKERQAPRPYEGMNIKGVTFGEEDNKKLEDAQKVTLKALGAVEKNH